MRDKNLEWITANGISRKIINMKNNHLCNALSQMKKRETSFKTMYGKERIDEYLYNFEQEIRYRKLNMLKKEDPENLF